MKKIVALLLVCVFAVFALSACGSEPCEVCGSEDNTEKVTISGESAYLCEDCAALAELGSAMMGGLN